MKKKLLPGVITTVLASVFVLASTSAMADTTYNLRSYFDSLGGNAPVQSITSTWGFYSGGVNGELMHPATGMYVPNELYQSIGSTQNIGTAGCSAGYCPSDPSTSLATFNGVFVHPGYVNPTTVVFRAQENTVVTQLKLWSETVGNANNGNGLFVTVNSFVNGTGSSLGSFGFDYLSTVTTFNEQTFNAPLTLSKGDYIEINYGNAGNYSYDHGNINVFVTTAPVPEPETYAMLLAGLGLIGTAIKRRRSIQR